jgi:hypothetical protein
MRRRSAFGATAAFLAALGPGVLHAWQEGLTDILPGAIQFSDGRPVEGAVFLGGTAALGGWAVWAEGRRRTGELNAPLVYAQQFWVAGLCDGEGRRWRPERGDPSPLSSIVSAPFRPSAALDPWVLGFVGAGTGLNAWLARREHAQGFSRARRVSYLGGSWGRNEGAAICGAYWIPLSLGAGVSEEMLFRGLLQARWEGEYGEVPGWLMASGLFGAAHLTSLTDPEVLLNAGFAAVAGLYLGWRYDAEGYRLETPVAAHFWFDVLAGVTAFAWDPANNPLGARITFSL